VKLAWHIAKKDFRRLWPLLALWWGVLGLRALTPALDIKMRDQPMDAFWTQLNNIRPAVWLGADILLLLVIGAAAVDTDSPIKPAVHWRMLPLTGRRVFAAKILFLALACGLAGAVINVGVKIAYGFPFANLLAGLGWFEWKIAACLALGFMLASLFRYPFFTLGIALVLYGCLVVLYELPFPWYVQNDGDTLYLTRFLVWSNLLLVTALGSARWMYYSRRRSWSRIILAAGVACAQILQVWWPYDLVAGTQNHDITELPAPKTDSLGFSWQIDPLQIISHHFSDPNFQFLAKSNLSLSAPHAPHPGEAWIAESGRWTLPLVVGQKLKFYGVPKLDLPVNYGEVLGSLGINLPQKGRFEFRLQSGGFSPGVLSSLEHTHLANPAPKLMGELQFLIGPMERIADVAVAVGAHFTRTPDSFAIQYVGILEGKVNFDLLYQEVEPAGPPIGMLDPHGKWYALNSSDIRDYFFVLWNAKRQEGVLARGIDIWQGPREGDGYGQNEGVGLSVSTFSVGISFEFESTPGSSRRSRAEMQQWLADARLVELRFTPEHFYTVPANLDGLSIIEEVIPPTSTPPTP